MVALTLATNQHNFGTSASSYQNVVDDDEQRRGTTGWLQDVAKKVDSTTELGEVVQAQSPEFDSPLISTVIDIKVVQMFQVISLSLAAVGGGGLVLAALGLLIPLSSPIFWQSGVLVAIAGTGLSVLSGRFYVKALSLSIPRNLITLPTGSEMEGQFDTKSSTGDLVPVDIDRTETRSTD